MASAQRQNWLAPQARDPAHGAVAPMAQVGRLLPGGEALGTADAVEHLTTTLEAWTEELALPRLSAYGVGHADLERLAAVADNRNNPIRLSREEIQTLLERRL